MHANLVIRYRMFTSLYCCFMPEDSVVSSFTRVLFMESTPFLVFFGYNLLRSFPVGESFPVKLGDHFRSRDHFQAGIICGLVQFSYPSSSSLLKLLTNDLNAFEGP